MQNVSSSNSQAVNVPKLRFPGFEEEWTKSNIGDIGSFFKGAPLSKADISKNGTPFILYGELYTTYGEVATDIKRKTEATVSDEYISKTGDVIIPTSGETPEDIATATCVMTPGVILAGDLCIMRNPKIDGRFLSYSINHKAKYKIARIAQGKSIVHIRPDEVEKISINYPTSAEQEKILKFLNLLAQKIEKQQALVDALKLYKRGVFSALSKRYLVNTTEEKLRAITICHDSRRIPMNSQERIHKKGLYPYYGANGIQDFVNDYIFEGEFVLLAEDGGHFEDFVEYSIAQYAVGKIWVNNHAHILQATKCDSKFLFYMLEHKDIRAFINGTSRAKLNQEDMLQITVPFPSIDIQHKITKTLENIDTKIAYSQEVLNASIIYKTALLQQMFI